MKLFKSDTTINITTRTLVKAIVLTVLAYVLLQIIGNITHQLRLIGVAAFLAVALNPAVTWITRRLRSKSRVRATGVAYIIVLTLLIGFLSLVIPPLVRQTTAFIQDVPQTINDFKNQDTALSRAVRKYDVEGRIDQIRDDFSNRTSNIAEPAISTAGRVGGTLISIITVFVLTFMMLIEGPLWYKRFLAMQPTEKRQKRQMLVRKMYRVVTGYVNGQVLIALVAATFAGVVLFILGTLFDAMINPIALAGIVFVMGLIPLIGNTIAAVIVVLACLLTSLPLAIIMAGYFLIYQQIENATLQPYIQSRSNQLTPLMIFIVALLGAGVGGLLGALAAIPIAGCIRVLVDDYLKTHYPDLESLEEAKNENEQLPSKS